MASTMKNDFYLTLLSNSSMDYFPENSLAHFFTKLPQKIDLLGNWIVGITEIAFNISSSSKPKKRKIIEEKDKLNYLVIDESDARLQNKKKSDVNYGTKIPILTGLINLTTALFLYLANTKLELEENYFESSMRKAISKTLLDDDNTDIQLLSTPYQGNPVVTIQVDMEKDKFNIPIYDSKFSSIEDFLETILKSIPKNQRNQRSLLLLARKSHIPPRVEIEYNNEIVSSVANHPALSFPTLEDISKRELMFVYTDIIRPQFVGNSLSRCLRTILLLNNSEVYKSFERIQYCSLERKSFDTIEILITAQNGSPYNFEPSATPTMVVLHFRQV